MHLYRLDDKKMDEDFLNGLPVRGRAFVPANKGVPIQEGDEMLVVLSSGKKYKGRVTKFSFFVLKGHQVGEVEFLRST